MLPKHVQETMENNGIKFQDQVRLCPNFYDKFNYVVHIAALKFYMEQGLELVTIHQGIRFFQSTWLKPYIALNTKKRSEATSNFEKNFFKLLINSVYGKCLENVRKYRDVRLTSSEAFAVKNASKVQYHSFTFIDDDIVSMELFKSSVVLCKPVSVGMTILDLSKLHMMRFHYEIMKPSFDHIEICFMDTDSYLYHIFGMNIREKLMELAEFFDFSNYPKDNPFYSNVNARKPGR